MVIDTKKVFAAIPKLAKNPPLLVAIIALSIPVAVLYFATKFVAASVDALVFFGILSVSVLVYSAWAIYCFSRILNIKSEKDV